MKLEMFAIYDLKADSYQTPFFAVNSPVAERMFSAMKSDSTTMVYRFPEDFRLFRVGEFDMVTGVFTVSMPQQLFVE